MNKFCLIIFAFVMFFLGGCADNPQKKVLNASILYLKVIDAHAYTKDWNQIYAPMIAHSRSNDSQFAGNFSFIMDIPPRHPGLNIYSNLSIGKIETYQINNNKYSNIPKTEIVYSVMVDFSIIAKTVDGILRILDKEEKASAYLIIAYDEVKKNYLVLDFYPDPTAVFISLKTFLRDTNRFVERSSSVIDDTHITKIKGEFLNY